MEVLILNPHYILILSYSKETYLKGKHDNVGIFMVELFLDCADCVLASRITRSAMQNVDIF